MNNALKEVTVELQSAKLELDELSNTKNSVMKELTDLQLTLAGKQKICVKYVYDHEMLKLGFKTS